MFPTVMPVPDTETAVCPTMKFVPVIVTFATEAASALAGSIAVAVGTGRVTENPVKGSESPVAVRTVMVRWPVAAVGAMVIWTDRVVALLALPMLAVTPVPLKTTDVAPVRLVPVIVAEIVELCAPEATDIPLMLGRVAGSIT